VPSPLRFFPNLRALVWGGRGLGESLGKHLPTGDAYGESWEVSDHDSHSSVVATGSLAGRTLRDLMRDDSAALLGTPREQFPWLVKFLDAHDWLSVQVHPDDRAVVRLWPGEGGKTEAWFILDARPGSRVYAGLLPGIDERALRGALATGRVAECLHSFEPRPGDCLFLPAGTVHAVGGGVLMAEVQQTSNATFRLFDWNRIDAHGKARELHIDKALACIDWDAGPVSPVRVPGYPDQAGEVPLVRCAYFDLDYHCLHHTRPLNTTPAMQVVLVLHGRGHYVADGSRHDLVPGDTLLFPAGMEPMLLVPDGALGLLAARLPG
jgi:mannose-6-phosphate isomerase